MKKRTNLMKRVLSFIMAFAMILTCVPAVALAAEETTMTLYLKPGVWTADNAWFAAWVWGSSSSGAWYKFEDTDGDLVYEAEVPADSTSAKFVRKDPTSSTLDWDYVWNDSGDQTISGNCYTVNGWDVAGSWSTYTPAETDPEPEPDPDPVTYTVYCINSAKWDAVAAYAWTGSDVNTEWPGVAMTKTSETVNGFDVYSVTFDVAYENVIFNNNNNGSQTPDLTPMAGQYYDVKNNAWYASLSDVPAIDVLATDCYLAGDFNGWSTTANEFKLDVEGSQTGYVSLELDAKTEYEFKVVQEGTWTSCTTIITDTVADLVFNSSVNDNVKITTTIAGTYVFAFDVSDSTLSVTYPKAEEPSEPTNPNTYEATFHFADVLGWGSVNLYTWTDAGTHCGTWPGTAVFKGDDGFYTMTVSFEAETNTGLNFIFNNGNVQTVNLALAASDFVDNKAEKWVVLTTTDSEGKYYADILDSGDSIAVSPLVNGTSVTFQYKNDSASSVEVRGSMNDWASGYTMTKNANGIWTATLSDLEPGSYEYKFVVDSAWLADPMNPGSGTDGNSSFQILNPNAVDNNQVTINIYYARADGIYETTVDGAAAKWNAYVWGDSFDGMRKDFEEDANGNMVTTLTVVGRETQYVNLKTRLSTAAKDWVKEENQVGVSLADIVSGTINVYVTSTGTGGNAGTTTADTVYESDLVKDNKVTNVQLDYDNGTVAVTALKPLTDPAAELKLVKDGAEIPVTIAASGTTYTMTMPEGVELDLVTLYRYKVTFDGYPYAIGIDSVYASDKFAEEYTYTTIDNTLGATWSSASTTFKVWAPTAEAVSVKLYDLSDKVYTARETTYPMTAGANGTWAVTIDGDLNGVYYNYLVTVDGETVEAVDPYARTTGVNGEIGMVVDLDSTDPEGWADDKNPNPVTSQTDAIIYELHVRDFSIDDSSGVSAANRGKYLAFSEAGTTTANGVTTGIDYLDKLGITHLHLLPVYDYGSVDETTCDTFNWGYDPQNYNVPEGSYSTDPYNGATRVKEFKQMVKSLHDHDISVIMDVVYNHVYDASKFCFNNIVPGYFSRVDSNRSGCGNDTASEREMVRKYIVESVLYWHQEYHIDGFRFDLVGLLDVETINQIVTEVHKCCPDVIFYGEGWDMDDTNREPGTEMAKQGNASKTTGFGYFSDSIRNLLGGNNGNSTGFVSGATGCEGDVAGNFMAKPWWTNNPQQVIQYASCHDNYTLIDKIVKSTGASGINDNIKKMSNLAAAVYLTAQGVPFIHAGEEFFREKLEENGDRCENSYNASDFVNHIEWSNLETADYAANVKYYQGLIEFRKAHPALRMNNATDIQSGVTTNTASDNVVAMFIDGSYAGDDDIFVIFNANNAAKSVSLPEGTWTINVKGTQAGTASLDTASGSVSVEAISAMVLTKADEGQDENTGSGTDHDAPPAGYKTIYFTNNKGWSTVNAYAWTSSGDKPNGDWPGTAMTYLETNGYGEDIYYTIIPTSAVNIIFNNGNEQTADLTCGEDGTGYYLVDNATGKWTAATYDYRDPVSGGDSGETGSSSDYYLFGYIDRANYGVEEDYTTLGKYKFDEDGKLTTSFISDSYVGVKTGDNIAWYQTNGWLGSVNSATLYDSNYHNVTKLDKLFVPGGVEITFTLTVNDDHTVTLSYEADTLFVEDESGIQAGVTLHCWNWSFAEIEAKMADIAAAGYTAIQTSPIQPLKETTTDSDKTVGGNWWVYYQPVDFKINTAAGNALGTKTELASMIETAHEYGIQVIVDVVANHLANQTGNNLSSAIPEYLLASEYWHDYTTNTTDYTNRYDITQHCMSGLPDLNTGNKKLQGYVLDFLKECIDVGVDGFRFDATKHIESPEDDATFASDFWPTILDGARAYAESKNQTLYAYGELLDEPGGNLPISAYTKYLAVTDNSWGNTLRENISSSTAAINAGYNKVADPAQLILWAESHDTYANADGGSADETEAEINKTWALVAARADAMGLYFARPASLDQALGVASVTGWANDEVKAVNKFHNAFDGQSEYIDTEDGIIYVERGTSGVVLVNASGTTATVEVAANKIDDGTYIDQITGNTFTVANGTISGEIGDTGIAVVVKLIDLEGATMTLGNSLAMNFVIDTAELIGTDNYAVITKEYADGTEANSVIINQADWKVYDGNMYYFTYSKVAAKEMTDEITVVVYNSADEAVTNSWTDSVRDYCMRAIKAEEEGNQNHDKLTLYVDMLNYGAAAQTEFENYHSDDLATSQLTEAQKAYATGVVNAEDHRVEGEGYLGSTLTLGNEIELNFIFDNNTVTQDMYAIATYTNHYGKEKSVTIEGSAFGEYNINNVNGWYIPVADMSVADGCQVNGESKFMVTCTVYNANGTVVTSAQDSVASYVARANADTNNTNPLYTLILKFATSAYNYFH